MAALKYLNSGVGKVSVNDGAEGRTICNLSAALPGADEIATANRHSFQVMVCYEDLGFSMLISQALKY